MRARERVELLYRLREVRSGRLLHACRERGEILVGGDIRLNKVSVNVFSERREYRASAYLSAFHCGGYEFKPAVFKFFRRRLIEAPRRQSVDIVDKRGAFQIEIFENVAIRNFFFIDFKCLQESVRTLVERTYSRDKPEDKRF